MKKQYKKPNICVVDFEILDLILASGDEDIGGGGDWDDWEWDSFGTNSYNGGYGGIGF